MTSESVPVVSVVMPIYNAAAFVRSAVESILAQTFRQLELIVVDDGSTDRTRDILASYTDPRMLVVRQDRAGIVEALNRGWELARGEFVARMDGDDVAYPDRLRKQVQWLREHPEIGILGSACHAMDDQNRFVGYWCWPETDEEVRWFCLFGSPFAHPTVMMRRAILVTSGLRYEGTYPTVEDYDLWRRLLTITKGANLPDALLRYRVHARSVTQTLGKRQWSMHEQVMRQVVRGVLPELAVDTERLGQLTRVLIGYRAIVAGQPVPLTSDLVQTYREIVRAYRKRFAEQRAVRRWRRREQAKLISLGLRQGGSTNWWRAIVSLIWNDPGVLWFPIQYGVRRLIEQFRFARLARSCRS